MPVKRSPVKPRTPQGQLIDVEGGETEAEMETITSVNADMLQRELQNAPQLTFRGEFQSPPTQALGATTGNGNGNGATAGNGNGNGATGGNSSLGRYVFGSEISYNKAPPRLPGLGC